MKRNRYIASALVLLCSAILLSGCIKETFPQSGSVTWDQKGKPNFEDPSTSLSVILIRNQVGGISEHYNFGYPGLLTAFDHAAGEIVPQGLNVGYDRYYPWFIIGLGWMANNSITARFVYENYYKFIKVANETIVMATGNDEMKIEMGLAKTHRALYYLDLARLYDPLPAKAPDRPAYETEIEKVLGLTVPRSTETMIDLEVFENNPRMTRDEIFTLIFADLDEAETLLADFTAPRKNVPSLAVVYGLKARAYLWLGGFTEAVGSHPVGNEAYRQAADYARRAINASGATMMTEAEWTNPTTGFNTIVSSWMWAMIQSSDTVINNLLSFTAHMAPEALYGYASGSQPGISIFTYNRMAENDFRKKIIYAPGSSYAAFAPYTTLTQDEFNGVGTPLASRINPYTFFKFRPGNGENDSDVVGNVTNIPLMRVEEMYLIEAEATAHYDEAAAKTLLETFMASRAPGYTVPDLIVNLVDEIILQKRIELWGEGIVLFDMKRLNMSIRNGDPGNNAPSGGRFVTDGRAPWWNFLFPLVSTQQNVALDGMNNPNPTGTYVSIDD